MKKVRCIVLRKVRYADADLILHTLDTAGSKMNFIARAAIKSKKRFGGGVLEPTHYIQATYQESQANKVGSMHVLKEATIIRDFGEIKKDYDRLNTAFHFLSLIDQMSQENDLDAENLFHLLGNSLKALEAKAVAPSLRLQFELKLLNYLGVLPHFAGVENYLKQAMGEQVESMGESHELERNVQNVIERYRKGLSV